jgi:cytochrome oxidase Cu insertion factor (SCO1/SenC/PrrC family)
MMTRLAAGSVFAAALWAAVAGGAPPPPAWEKMGVIAYEAPKPAPAFALPGLDGHPVKLEDYKGKALLLFFWATW